MGEGWLSGRKRQTVNLLVILALVRIQPPSKRKLNNFLGATQLQAVLKNNFRFKKKFRPKSIQIVFNLTFKQLYYSNVYFFTKLLTHLLFRFLGKLKTENNILNFTFRNSKLYINFNRNNPTYNYFSLSPGLLLNFFSSKKGLKKKLKLKVLNIRFLRKILLLLKLNIFTLKISGNSLNYKSLLTQLFTDLPHFFVNPLTGLRFFDKPLTYKKFQINEIVLRQTTNFLPE